MSSTEKPVYLLNPLLLREARKNFYRFWQVLCGQLPQPSLSDSQIFSRMTASLLGNAGKLPSFFHPIDTTSRRTKDWTSGKEEAISAGSWPVLASDVELARELAMTCWCHPLLRGKEKQILKNSHVATSEVIDDDQWDFSLRLETDFTGIPLVLQDHSLILVKTVDRMDDVGFAFDRGGWAREAACAMFAYSAEDDVQPVAKLLVAEKQEPKGVTAFHPINACELREDLRYWVRTVGNLIKEAQEDEGALRYATIPRPFHM